MSNNIKKNNNKNNSENNKESKDNDISEENFNYINDETSRLNEDEQFQHLSSRFKEEKLKLRPELNDLKKEVLHFGSDIIDGEDQKKYEDRPALEKLGHKLYNIYENISILPLKFHKNS